MLSVVNKYNTKKGSGSKFQPCGTPVVCKRVKATVIYVMYSIPEIRSKETN